MSSFLKQLHVLLSRLSPDEYLHRVIYGDATSMDVQNQWLMTKVKYEEISELSNLLFDKLHRQFDLVFYSIGLVPSSMCVKGDGHVAPDVDVCQDEFMLLLLKCCTIMLQFLEFDLSVVMEKCQILIAILKKLCSLGRPLEYCSLNIGKNRTIRNSSLGQCTNAPGERSVGARQPTSSLCSTLEVLIGEVVVNQQLRMHIMIADYVSDKEKLFISHGSCGDVNIILELLSCHFVLSVHYEWAIDQYIHGVPWSNDAIFEAPVLSMSAALTLLGTPVIFTAPHMFQAHLILLVSRCIGIQNMDGWKSDALILDRYVAAFELSVNLYAKYISSIEFCDCPGINMGHSSFSFDEPSFESCIRPDTCDKLKLQISKLLDFLHKESYGMTSGTKAGFLKHSTAYIMQNLQFIDELFRDEACSILNCIVSAVLRDEVLTKSFQYSGKRNLEKNYCLAAVMRLLSSLLLQISSILRQNESLGRTKKGRDHIVCREYSHISDLICSLGKLGAYKNVKEIFMDRLETNHGKHNGTQLMLVHFASLLSYSFRRRIEFLWMRGIFLMIAWMNYLVTKEGSLDAFRPLLSYIEETSTTQFSLAQNSQELHHQKSSVVIASHIRSMQMLHSKDQVECLKGGDQGLDANESNETVRQDGGSDISKFNFSIQDPEPRNPLIPEADSCSGELFIKCLPEFHRKSSDWDDLVDFIECRHGKDYSSWLNKRERFRKWQYKKIEVVRHQKRKKVRRRNFF